MSNDKSFLGCLAGLTGTLLLVLSGCTSSPTTQPTDASQRQEAILNDPMSYKPQMDQTVTGGDDNISHFGKGINNDVNDFLNP